MAFTTIPASGSTPVQFVGTNSPDAIDIQTTSTFILTGEGANDSVVYSTQVFNSALSLGDGNDILTGNVLGGGSLVQTRVNGNAGADTFGNAQRGISVSNSNPNVTVSGGASAGILGGQDGDTIFLSFLQTSRVNGNLGDDVIFTAVAGGATVNVSDSEIFGGQGNDTLNIGNTLYTNTAIAGDLGNDLINIAITTAGNGFVNTAADGGDGNDTINASASTVDLATLIGGNGDDSILGGTGNDQMQGDAGNDTLAGGAGSDSIFGGSDDDTINGGAGTDSLTGGTGNDTFQQGAGSTGTLGLVAQPAAPIPANYFASSTPGFGIFVDTTNPAGVTYQFLNGSIFDRGGDFTLNAGDTFTLNTGFDVITDWQASDLLQTGTVNYALGDFNNISEMTRNYSLPPAGFNLPLAPVLGASYNVAVRGNWNNANSFEVSSNNATGADILVFTYTYTGATPANWATDFANVSNWTVLDNVAAGISIGQGNWV